MGDGLILCHQQVPDMETGRSTILYLHEPDVWSPVGVVHPLAFGGVDGALRGTVICKNCKVGVFPNEMEKLTRSLCFQKESG